MTMSHFGTLCFHFLELHVILKICEVSAQHFSDNCGLRLGVRSLQELDLNHTSKNGI